MLRYTSDDKNFEIQVNGLLRNQVYFRLESIDSVSTSADEHGIFSVVIILKNATKIALIRTNRHGSMELVTEMFNDLMEQFKDE